MKKRVKQIGYSAIVLLSIVLSCTHYNPEASRDRERLFNDDWLFIRDSLSGAENPGFDDAAWKTVDLPHDYSMMALPEGVDHIGPFSRKSPGKGNATGHVLGGTGWYRKHFTLDKTDEGQNVVLQFDGVYMESEVWVNGKPAGSHKNGYTPFWFDITSLLNPAGEPNVVAVKVDNTGRNSRWYSGSGIYRNVHLIVADPVHVAVWGTRITTPEPGSDKAMAAIEVTAENKGTSPADVQFVIQVKDKDGNSVGQATLDAELAAAGSQTFKDTVEIASPSLWSPDSPVLYTAEILIKKGRKTLDAVTQSFGIRSIEITTEKGFVLNGIPMELKGGCMHHDNGLLGSAAYDRAEERKVEIMKASGFNAIRCAHNPPSESFLNACDRLGMLVIDEFTDMWEVRKNPQDYSRFFRDYWKQDLTDMILRDRNHPSIIMWSIGNEVPGYYDSLGIQTASQLVAHVKSLDNTRAVTEAVTAFFTPGGWENTAGAFALLDVCGYNYEWRKYESDHLKYPDRIIYGSETFPLAAFDTWKATEKLPYVIGDFVWTSMDYMGEVLIGNATYVPKGKESNTFEIPDNIQFPPGINIFDIISDMSPTSWPAYIAGCGDIDITGTGKSQLLYRKVLWDKSKLEINVHAPVPAGMAENITMWGWPKEFPHWNWVGNESKPIQVRVFTKATRVRLEINGKPAGEKNLTPDDKYIAVFDIPYEPGTLKAIALENETEIASKSVTATGKVAGLKLTADREILTANRNDLSFVTIEAVDDKGNPVPDASIQVKLTVSGGGEMVASGNANPVDMQSVNVPVIRTYNGMAQAILRPYAEKGTLTLTAESDGLKPTVLNVEVQ